MKNIFVGAVAALGIGLLIWYFLKGSKEGTDDAGKCIKVNRNKFTVRWIEDQRPSGTMGEIAQDIFGSSDSEFGSVVGGFFKAIDVYPSAAAGKYYKSQITAYYDSSDGLPWWNVEKGELACKT